MNRYAVIMAGGRGERFWPKSRSDRPKQFLTLAGNRSLLQQSVDRIKKMFNDDHIYIVLGRHHLKLAQEQLPELPSENFIVEPAGRNTAPCIGLAAVHIQKRDPDAGMLVFPADHLIKGDKKFLECLDKGFSWASRDDALVTIGIVPTRPETGYGYIERDAETKDQNPSVFSVKRFIEKPDLPRAEKFYGDNRYYWNSGIFIWRVPVILQRMEEEMPALYEGLQRIEAAIGTDGQATVLEEVFPHLPAISIDYGIMEKSPRILMVEGNFGWDDLGSWGALAEIADADENGMAVHGHFVGFDNENCYIQSEGSLIAAVGLQNLVIVQDGDVILVCPRHRTQDVKELVRLLKEDQREEYL